MVGRGGAVVSGVTFRRLRILRAKVNDREANWRWEGLRKFYPQAGEDERRDKAIG